MPLVQRIHEVLMSEMSSAGVYLLRLVMAALLGGAIGLEREIKHRPSGLRTNLFICVGAALLLCCRMHWRSATSATTPA